MNKQRTSIPQDSNILLNYIVAKCETFCDFLTLLNNRKVFSICVKGDAIMHQSHDNSSTRIGAL